MKKQVFNPYLPSWEYIPDGEPHVFGDRVYIFGSHDEFNGCVFCPGDYVCYSAPISDLTDWKYEGVIYKKSDDKINAEGKMVLYAPDVTQGADGRFYLYYVFDKVNVVSVAVCDKPAGKYEFYGYVHYKDGTRLGEKSSDMPQFDPAVITEGKTTYLYTGFSGNGMKDRVGAMAITLGEDMLTIEKEPVVIIPGNCYSFKPEEIESKLKENNVTCNYQLNSKQNWESYKNHEFFEAPSIRKIGDTYYFVYSSVVMHELCYATSKSPTDNFVYQGVIVSNNDMHIDSYKPAQMPAAYGCNNHGGIVKINEQWYIFYHRHTNGTWFSRQGCAEKITIQNDGKIPQVQLTSCGLNNGPLIAKGVYPSYIACNLFTEKECPYVSGSDEFPKITQDGKDGDEINGYITNIKNSATIGFKIFEFTDIKKISINTRAYIDGVFEIKTKWDGEVLGKIKVSFSNFWEENSCEVNIPNGVHDLYLTFKGNGSGQLRDIKFE